MTISCPLCDYKTDRKYEKHDGYQIGKHYAIHHCPACITAFASPLEVDHAIYNHIYANVATVPGYERYLRYANEILTVNNPLQYLAEQEDVYWGIIQYLKSRPGKKLKILEVGCGFGYLTYALTKAGHDVLGLDISSSVIQEAQNKYGPHYVCADVNEYAKQHSGEYDLVVATEVIEHIPAVISFMKSLQILLNQSGEMIITTPNRSYYHGDVLWETEPPPVHLWWFGESSMIQITHTLNMSVRFIDFSEYNRDHSEQFSFLNSLLTLPHLQPTRLPRLDFDGSVIPIEVIRWKKYLKEILTKLGLLESILGLKKKMRHKKEKNFHKKRKYIPQNSERRPILCAIFSKK